jgi:hypothetical protein
MSPHLWSYESGNIYARALGYSQNTVQKLLRERFSSADLSNKEDTAATLIDVLRSLPPHDPTVGRDCLVTTIQAVPPHVRIKYEPYGITQMSVEFDSGKTVTVEAASTPWIITPNQLLAPLAMNLPLIPFPPAALTSARRDRTRRAIYRSSRASRGACGLRDTSCVAGKQRSPFGRTMPLFHRTSSRTRIRAGSSCSTERCTESRPISTAIDSALSCQTG